MIAVPVLVETGAAAAHIFRRTWQGCVCFEDLGATFRNPQKAALWVDLRRSAFGSVRAHCWHWLAKLVVADVQIDQETALRNAMKLAKCASTLNDCHLLAAKCIYAPLFLR